VIESSLGFQQGTGAELMRFPPFATPPVFRGDDVTDQAAFRVLPEFGGTDIRSATSSPAWPLFPEAAGRPEWLYQMQPPLRRDDGAPQPRPWPIEPNQTIIRYCAGYANLRTRGEHSSCATSVQVSVSFYSRARRAAIGATRHSVEQIAVPDVKQRSSAVSKSPSMPPSSASPHLVGWSGKSRHAPRLRPGSVQDKVTYITLDLAKRITRNITTASPTACCGDPALPRRPCRILAPDLIGITCGNDHFRT